MATAVLALATFGAAHIPLLDDDEPRFAAASREMMRGGSWIVPQFDGRERLDKPPLVYWLQATSMALAITLPFKPALEAAVRFPSALGIAMAAWLTALIARRLGATTPNALLAGFALGSCTQAQIVAHAATADGLLLGLTTLAAWFQIERHRGGRGPMLHTALGLTLAAIFLTKGPPGWIAPLALAVGLHYFAPPNGPCDGAARSGRSRKQTVGVFLVAAVPILLWVVPAWIATNGRLLTEGFVFHVLRRSVVPFEGHGGYGPQWWLFYLVAVPVTWFPWSLFLWRISCFFVAPATDQPWRKVLAVWLGGTLLTFTLAISKLPHYPLPAFPALAIATAAALAHRLTPAQRRIERVLACSILPLSIAVFYIPRLMRGAGLAELAVSFGWFSAAGAALVVVGLVALIGGNVRLATGAVALLAVLAVFAPITALTRHRDLLLSARIRDVLAPAATGALVLSSETHEASAVFYLDRSWSNASAQTHDPDGNPKRVFELTRQLVRPTEIQKSRSTPATKLPRSLLTQSPQSPLRSPSGELCVEGFQVSRGDWLRLCLRQLELPQTGSKNTEPKD